MYVHVFFSINSGSRAQEKVKMSSILTEIHENTKMGRESALLGDYETSLVYYQGVIQQIQRHLGSIRDPTSKQRWQKVSFVQMYSVYKIHEGVL